MVVYRVRPGMLPCESVSTANILETPAYTVAIREIKRPEYRVVKAINRNCRKCIDNIRTCSCVTIGSVDLSTGRKTRASKLLTARPIPDERGWCV